MHAAGKNTIFSFLKEISPYSDKALKLMLERRKEKVIYWVPCEKSVFYSYGMLTIKSHLNYVDISKEKILGAFDLHLICFA
jgi:hypothetical protein